MPDSRPTAPSLGLCVRAILLAIATLLALAWLVPPRPPGGDGPIYLAMVEDLGSGTGVQAHRILGPWLVARSGLPPELGFRLLTYVSLLLMALGLFGAAAVLGLGARASLLCIPLALTSWAGIGNLWDYLLVDALTWALVAAAWWALAGHRLWLVAVFAAIGTLAKEVALLVSIAAAIAVWRWRTPARSAAIAVGLVMPPAAALVAVTVWSGLSPGDAASYWQSWLETLQALGGRYLLNMTFSAYGLSWLLALRGLFLAPAVARARCLALLAAGAPLLLAGTPERMAEFLAPAIVTLAAITASRYHPVIVAAQVVGNALFITHRASGLLRSDYAAAILLAILALAVVAELAVWVRSQALGSGVILLNTFSRVLAAAALALCGGLYLSLGAPHGGFRRIELPPSAAVAPRLDLVVIAASEGLVNGEPAVLGIIQNDGRAIAWSPTIGDGRVLLHMIEPGQNAPFVARSTDNLHPTASLDPPSGEQPSTDLRSIQVRLQKDTSGGTLVEGRILNTSSVPLKSVRVIVLAHRSDGTPSALIETLAEVDQDSLAPGSAEPFHVHFPAEVEVAEVTIFGEGTIIR